MMQGRYPHACLVLALAVSIGVVVRGASGGGAPLTLVDAVKVGDTAAVRALLAKHANVNTTTTDGTTALHWAVHRNDLATVDQLIRAGANVKLANSYGVTPISMAAETGTAAVVERLLKAGADPNVTLVGGETVLMTAARAGNADAVKLLLAHGANVDARETTRDQTALMWAAAGGHTATVKVLLEGGADLKARSTELKAFHEGTFIAGRKTADSGERLPMFTPLLFAARSGHIDAARVLLDHGADVNDKVRDGTTALHVAIINAHWELGAMLLDRGADPNAESPGGTALHHIARVRSEKILVRTGGAPPPEPSGAMTSLDLAKALVAHGANVNARVTKPIGPTYGSRAGAQVGLTPLLMTAIPADPDYMNVLLASGADPKMTLNNRTTLLMAAAGIGLGSLLGDDEEAFANVKKAVELGLDVNARNDEGDTALHGAVFRAYIPLVQYLIDQGAQLDAKNKIGWTPLMEAHWTGRGLLNTRPEVEALLRKLYEAHGLPTTVTSREEAIQKLIYDKGGPIISCPAGLTVPSAGGGPTVVNYPEATATTRRRYGKLETTCTPSTGSEFPVGSTTVTCTAKDDNGRTDSCTVLMRVLP
jgi:ankyrin repeat protein